MIYFYLGHLNYFLSAIDLNRYKTMEFNKPVKNGLLIMFKTYLSHSRAVFFIVLYICALLSVYFGFMNIHKYYLIYKNLSNI